MAASSPDLASLAASVSEGLNALTSHFKSSGQAIPSFAENSPPSYDLSPELAGRRVELLQQLHDVALLVQGPNDALGFQPLLANHDQMTLDMLNQFDFYHAVPLGGSATYTEIASKTKLPEDIVRRFLRHAFTQRIFSETHPGSDSVVHTAMSAHHARTPSLFSWHRHNLQEIRPGASHVPEAMRKGTTAEGKLIEDDTQCGFALADLDRTGKPVPFWQYLKGVTETEKEGYRSQQFAGAMEFLTQSSKVTDTNPIVSGFDWASLGSGTVVDVGGSSGHDAAILTEAFPELTVIVQDLPENEPSFKAHVPQALTSRLSFQAHDFFTPQPVKSVDVFFLKTILHDWDDEQSVKIVRNLLPSLKKGGRIVLTEVVVPAPEDPVPWMLRKATSAGDLQMLIAFNGRDRSLKQWDAVLKKADGGLNIKGVKMVPGSWRSVIEVALD